MILPIYLYGSPVLRAMSKEVDIKDKKHIETLLLDMNETLEKADGCGLAAPQVGVNERVIIVDGRELSDVYDYLKDFKRTMINPVILESSDKLNEYSEGCLSIPGIYADVKRTSAIKVEYYNENLEKIVEEFDKFACRMILHEIDHIDGVLFIDRLAPIRRKMISKKLFNISQGKVNTKYKTKQ